MTALESLKEDESDIPEYVETLVDDGIIVIKDYFDSNVCDEIYDKVSEIIEQETCDVLSPEEDTSYQYLADHESTILNKRGGREKGFYDIFHIDHTIQELKDFKYDGEIMEIINAAGLYDYQPEATNIYWKESVSQTRGFHHDTYSEKFKSFVYLTDVKSKADGPYTYVKGSHEPSVLKQKGTSLVNKLKRKKVTDAVFYDEENIKYCTGPKGTLIISNQTGIHKGCPQEEGYERMLATTHFGQTT